VLIEAIGLKKHFMRAGPLGRRDVTRAVDGVDFSLDQGRTLSVVGESGCGKSTLSRMILRLTEPTEGTVRFRGRDIGSLDAAQMKQLRREMQVVFQNPYGSLNPRQSIETILEEPLRIHGIGDAGERSRTVTRLMDMVGIPPAHRRRYPHEFSGGQRQRIGIARALALDPVLVVCDEPVSALDVSVKAQIINLLLELQRELGLAYLFISHDLSVVRHISDDVAVMYLGRMVELAPSQVLYREPLHPYTEALLAAVPQPDPERRGRMVAIRGDIANASPHERGCRFRGRCAHAREQCGESEPDWKEWRPQHWARCWRIDEIRGGS
jgi:oligopeptide/dipeptide ABC transporter ATP-binding protein